MALIARFQMDGFKAPAGPPLGRQLTMLVGEIALVAGAGDDDLSAVLPASGGFSLGCRRTNPPGANAGHLSFSISGAHHLIVTSSNALDVDTVAYAVFF